MSCTSSDLAKFQTDSDKLVKGVAFTRYPVFIYFGRSREVQTAKKKVTRLQSEYYS